MRLIAVTHGVSSVGYVDRVVRKHLDVLSVKYSILLLGQHVCDPGFLCVEVVPHFLHGVGLGTLLHDWLALDLTVLVLGTSGVKYA